MNIVVMIPSLNPDAALVDYVKELSAQDFTQIVVINDGSPKKYKTIFARLAKLPRCKVLSHKVNRGKGCALKTGMKYVRSRFPDCLGVVTADADGQHTAKDVLRVAGELEADGSHLVLGSRDFNQPDIPPRSRFGNKLTSLVFAAMFGQKLMDTQTGLRGIPMSMIPTMLAVKGDRYEYEMNMLIECRKQKTEIHEIPIETVYIEDNGSSHFRPVVDSVKIYWLICRSFFSFVFTSLSCMALDLLLFTLLAKVILPQDFGWRIQIATVVARVISSTANFLLNKNIVFHKSGHLASSAAKYFCLAAVQMLVSANAVSLLYSLLKWPELLIKIIVDSILFIVNYFVQKKIIFRP